MKTYKELDLLHERTDPMTEYIVTCRDSDGNLKRLIEYIGENGNTGHSFSIVVDPGDEREKTFEWDGDGPDRIDSVKEK